jgi:hypothetical protein
LIRSSKVFRRLPKNYVKNAGLTPGVFLFYVGRSRARNRHPGQISEHLKRGTVSAQKKTAAIGWRLSVVLVCAEKTLRDFLKNLSKKP